MDIVITKVKNSRNPDRCYELKIRDHGPVETDYYHLCYVDHWTAHQLPEMGSVRWLYGDPETNLETNALRHRYPALKEAWDHYQSIKKMVSNG